MRWHVAAVWLVVLGWCGNSFVTAQPMGSPERDRFTLAANEDQPSALSNNVLVRNLQLQALSGELYDPVAAWQVENYSTALLNSYCYRPNLYVNKILILKKGRLKRQNLHHHHHARGEGSNSNANSNNNNNFMENRNNNLVENRNNNNFVENRNTNANNNNNVGGGGGSNGNGNGNGQMPLLSISSPIEALRARLRLEMIRRAADHQIKENKKLLDGLGKRRKRSVIAASNPYDG